MDYTVRKIAESLLQQLACIRLARSNAMMVIEQHRTRNTRPSLSEILAALHHEISTYSDVYIIIDALDEFGLHDEGLIDEFVQVIQAFPRSAHTLITSRDIPSISGFFRDEIRLTITADDTDMRAYIEECLAKPGPLNRQVKGPPSLREKVISKVIEKACGMYVARRYASFLLL
jgi:hypothetical protein